VVFLPPLFFLDNFSYSIAFCRDDNFGTIQMPARESNAIIIGARSVKLDRSRPNEPYVSLPWEDLDALYGAMVADLLQHACHYGEASVHFYRNPAEFSNDFLAPFRSTVQCFDLFGDSPAELFHHAIDTAFAARYSRVVAVIDNHPLLNPRFFKRVFDLLTYEDDCIVVGPTAEGRCSFVGMKSNYSWIFERLEHLPDPITTPYAVLGRICETDALVFPTSTRYVLDSGFGLARLRSELETMSASAEDFPRRTQEIFRMFDKKYRVKKQAK
jgi:hypothetical protein